MDVLFFELNLVPLKAISLSVFLYLLLRDILFFATRTVLGQKQALETITISSVKLLFEWVKAASVSPSKVRWGQPSHQMEKKDEAFCSLHLSLATSFCFFRYDGVKKSATTNFPLCSMNWKSIICAFCWLQNKQNVSQKPWGHQGEIWKTISLYKLLAFFPLSSANFKMLTYLHLLRLTHWQSLKLFLNSKGKAQVFSYNI